MKEVTNRINELWTAAKKYEGGIEGHRKLSHMEKAIRFGLDLLRAEEVRTKIDLYREKIALQMKERYGKQIEMK